MEYARIHKHSDIVDMNEHAHNQMFVYATHVQKNKRPEFGLAVSL
jgi:hypothetical protein